MSPIRCCPFVPFAWLLLCCCAVPVSVASGDDGGLVVVGKTELLVTEVPFTVTAPAGDPKKTLYFWSSPAGAVTVDKGSQLVVTQMAGRGQFDVKIVGWTPEGFTQEFLSLVVRVAGPEPPPPPGPLPPDPPAPPVQTLWLVAVEESAEAKADRAAWIGYAPLRDYFQSKGHKARIIDQDVKGPDGQAPADLAPYLAGAKGQPLPYLFLVDQAGTVLYRGGLPATPAALLALVKKVGG